ncbi:MAG: ATP synthase A1 subunit C [Candidatus Methanomethylophilaceae archaeon]|jgi:V/A-type H+-transporting ATPase subunit C
MFRRNTRRGNYAYTVARVKAKKSLLMKEEDYEKMLMMSLPEISRYMSESGYQKEMSELAGRMSGIDLVEYAAYLNLSKVFKSILKASEGELYTMVSAYLDKWNIWNVRQIIRGKSFGLDEASIREDLVAAGSLSEEDLEKLLSLSTVEEVVTEYSRMDSVNIPQDVISSYALSGSLAIIEDHLYKFRYSRLLEAIVPNSRPTLMFQDYVRREIDTVNFSTILKLKAEGIYGEAAVANYIIPGGKQIDRRTGVQLANAETIAAMASEASQLDFYENIRHHMESENVSIRCIESAMKKYGMGLANKFSHMNPLSVAPVVDYMIHKETEVFNILAIARGLQSGIDTDTIKGLLVI